MNTIRRRALLWEQRSQNDLNQTIKAGGFIVIKAANLVLFLIWQSLKLIGSLSFWLIAGSRPVIRIYEHQYQELNEVFPTVHSEPATQIQQLGRKA